MNDASHNPRTVLIVAGEFPPLKTIGRIRTVKFAEHLLGLGWHPIVLTLEPSGAEGNYDPSLNDEIAPGVEVVRLPLVTFEDRVVRFAKRLLGRAPASSGEQAASAPGGGQQQAAPAGQSRPGLVERLQVAVKRWIRAGLDVPDNYLPWAMKAVPVAMELARERKVDVIFTTLPPFSAAYVGYRVRRDAGIPWIADYRDLWYGDVLREWLPGWRTRLELWLEKRWLKRADVVVTVSEQKTRFMRELHPSLPIRWETLTNGYDTEIYAARERTRGFDAGEIQFVYTGRLFKNRRGYAFAEALGRIKRSAPELVSPVRVRILGGVAPEIRARYDEILAEYGIAAQFDFAGDVSYQEAMDAQVNCDYLLLIVDYGETSDGVIPGKLFEYVAAKRPMFALCNPGATEQIIREAGLGVVVDVEDVDACERELRQLLQQPVPVEAGRDEDYLSQFDRKVISGKLACLLDETAGR